MQFIAHRINTIKDLLNTPTEYGVEIDLRDYQNKIILQHDPFKDGEYFEEYLKNYNHGTMILNIKSEGIEPAVLKLIKKYNVRDYFFLDCSFPMINFLSSKGERNIALRFSEFEGLDTIRLMSQKVDWLWVDCFTKLPINNSNYKIIKSLNYKLCLVSPELQRQNSKLNIYKLFLKEKNIEFNAICTKLKNIKKWQY
ncbi:hypothetical protein OAT23_04015 [Candidatus Pelagibacter sp.]|jgi:hypothetical protein|nr:hypothetical protein [Candidatus Pelagibacter sp.]